MTEKNSTSKKRTLKSTIYMVLALLAVVIAAAVLLRQAVRRPSRGIFGTNMVGIATALRVYASDHHGVLPPDDQWCDLLIQGDYCMPKQFVCGKSGAIEGESSVAINKNIAGKELARLDPNVVLLFETDFGKDPHGRQELIKNRDLYKTWPHGEPDTKVYKDRWNQAGGPEIMTTHHKFQQGGKAYYVAFVSGQVWHIKTADLPNLKWKSDPNDK